MTNKPVRREYEGLAPLTKEVRAITKTALGVRGFSGIDILQHWTDIVGADLAKGIFPQKLLFEKQSRTNGTLVVKTAGGAFAMLLEHQKERVLQRINTFFGYKAVARIKMIQGALKLTPPVQEVPKVSLTKAQQQQIKEKVSCIEDENLRLRMRAIAEELLKRQVPKA